MSKLIYHMAAGKKRLNIESSAGLPDGVWLFRMSYPSTRGSFTLAKKHAFLLRLCNPFIFHFDSVLAQ